MENFNLTFTNSDDYFKLHFWLLVLLVTFGSVLFFMLFKQSWVALLFLFAVVIFVRNRLKIRVRLSQNKTLSIRKELFGLPYFISTIRFNDILHNKLTRTLIFRGTEDSFILDFNYAVNCSVSDKKFQLLKSPDKSDSLYSDLLENLTNKGYKISEFGYY